MVDIPVFVPEYDKDKKYGWTNYKDELWDLLKETTHGYCMYCYDRIWINQERRGQIEHGIEKKNSMKRLQDCVPNLGSHAEGPGQAGQGIDFLRPGGRRLSQGYSGGRIARRHEHRRRQI